MTREDAIRKLDGLQNQLSQVRNTMISQDWYSDEPIDAAMQLATDALWDAISTIAILKQKEA